MNVPVVSYRPLPPSPLIIIIACVCGCTDSVACSARNRILKRHRRRQCASIVRTMLTQDFTLPCNIVQHCTIIVQSLYNIVQMLTDVDCDNETRDFVARLSEYPSPKTSEP